MIKYSEVFPILAGAIPTFTPEEDEWREPTPYFFLDEMVRFVDGRTRSGSDQERKQFALLMEELVTTGDLDIQNLISDSFESLWECKGRDQVASSFRTETQRLWEAYCELRE